MLEVVNQEGGSTVWEDCFRTEEEALAEALNTIETEGIACFFHESINRPSVIAAYKPLPGRPR
jgi:hypothetical protein